MATEEPEDASFDDISTMGLKDKFINRLSGGAIVENRILEEEYRTAKAERKRVEFENTNLLHQFQNEKDAKDQLYTRLVHLSKTVTTAPGTGGMSVDANIMAGVFDQTFTFDRAKDVVTKDELAYRGWSRRKHDPFNKWLTVRSSDQFFQEQITNIFNRLHVKNAFEDAWGWALLLGCGPILKLYDNDTMASDLSQPMPDFDNANITGLVVIGLDTVEQILIENDPTKRNYGQIRAITMTPSGKQAKEIHASRLILLSKPHPCGDPRGISLFFPVWDMFTFKKNADIAQINTLVSNSRRLPVFLLQDADSKTIDNIEDAVEGVGHTDSALILNNTGKESSIVEIAGAGSLNPEPYTKYILQCLSAGIGVPMHVLLDIEAGALVGSSENVKNYLTMISNNQTEDIEPHLVELINELIVRGQLPAKDYNAEWNPLEEISFADKSQAVMREGLGMLNYSKALAEFSQIPGINFTPTDWEIVPPPTWTGIELRKKPESEPEKYYQANSVGEPMATYPLSSDELVESLTAPNRVIINYGEDAFTNHYDNIYMRIYSSVHKAFTQETAISKKEAEDFENSYFSPMSEHKHGEFLSFLNSCTSTNIRKIKVDGTCPQCRREGRYGVYQTDNVDGIPRFPLHGDGCDFEYSTY